MEWRDYWGFLFRGRINLGQCCGSCALVGRKKCSRVTFSREIWVKYEDYRRILIEYLKAKVDAADWHGAADACNDLRELEARERGKQERENERGDCR